MKALLYCRVSSTSDRQSTDRQEGDLLDYAKRNGIEVVKCFSEKISGAANIKNRQVLLDCIDFAINNGIQIILFSELSRLGRDLTQILNVIDILKNHKINAYFQKEDIKLLDNRGNESLTTKLLIRVIGIVAEIERENIKFRLNSGRARAIANNVKMGRKVGYRQSREDYMKRYPESIKLLKKGLKIPQIEVLAKSKGEKVGKSTLFTLKKMFISAQI